MGIMYKLMKHRNLTMDLNNSPHNNNTNIIKSDRNRLITIEGNIIDNPETTITRDSSEADFNNKNMDSNMDKQFTAEHIIQLCKFLAEKSKRNKNLYKQQQSPKKLIKSKQSQFQFQQMDYEDNDESDLYQNEALPLLSQQRREQQQKQQRRKQQTDDEFHEDNNDEEDNEFEKQKTSAILSTRLSPDINSLNISSNTTISANSCALQHHHHHQQQQQQQQIFNYPSQQQYQQTAQNQGKRDILLKIRRQIFERKRLRENGAFEPQALNNSQVWRPW